MKKRKLRKRFERNNNNNNKSLIKFQIFNRTGGKCYLCKTIADGEGANLVYDNYNKLGEPVCNIGYLLCSKIDYQQRVPGIKSMYYQSLAFQNMTILATGYLHTWNAILRKVSMTCE